MCAAARLVRFANVMTACRYGKYFL